MNSCDLTLIRADGAGHSAQACLRGNRCHRITRCIEGARDGRDPRLHGHQHPAIAWVCCQSRNIRPATSCRLRFEHACRQVDIADQAGAMRSAIGIGDPDLAALHCQAAYQQVAGADGIESLRWRGIRDRRDVDRRDRVPVRALGEVGIQRAAVRRETNIIDAVLPVERGHIVANQIGDHDGREGGITTSGEDITRTHLGIDQHLKVLIDLRDRGDGVGARATRRHRRQQQPTCYGRHQQLALMAHGFPR